MEFNEALFDQWTEVLDISGIYIIIMHSVLLLFINPLIPAWICFVLVADNAASYKANTMVL